MGTRSLTFILSSEHLSDVSVGPLGSAEMCLHFHSFPETLHVQIRFPVLSEGSLGMCFLVSEWLKLGVRT